MRKTEEAAHTATLGKQSALKNEAAGGLHLKVTGGTLAAYKKAAPHALSEIMAALAAEKEARRKAVIAALTVLKVGQLTEDGIYIGHFTGEDHVEKYWFASPEDVRDAGGSRLSLDFEKATEYAQNSRALGHDDWRLPSGKADPHGEPDILRELFNSKSIGAFKDTFDDTDYGNEVHAECFPACWYQSSSLKDDEHKWVQRFSDGYPDIADKTTRMSARLVRSVAV